MSRGPALPGEMGEAGDDGSAGDRPPSDAAPRGPGWKLGAAACAAETKRTAQPVLQTRPAGRLPGGRPGWAAPAPKPALAQRPPESGPGLTIRALGVPSRRTRAVNHGSCRSALTSQFGVGAGPSLALDSAFQARDPGPHRGHIPPEDHGQQRTLAVDRPRSSARPFGHNRRSSEHPGSLSHGSGHRLCAARRIARVMAPQAMTQQQRALPTKHGRFVRNAQDRFGVLQRGACPTSRQASPSAP